MPMDASTPEGKVVSVLQQELRARGLYYRDIAARMGVSESTVKRYFTRKDISFTVLRRLAEVADLDLGALITLAERQGVAERKFTKAQQTALAKSRFLSMIFFLLWHGWTPPQIGQEFDIRQELDDAVEKLQALGLIRRLAHGVKILATPKVDERGGGLLGDLTTDVANQFLGELNLRDPRCVWSFYVIRLSSTSMAQLREIVKKFVDDTRALMTKDLALPSEKVQWHRLFVSVQPTSRKSILPRR
jgi:transcriptional regulator with XRE-family HTH domain